jgi:hypothetical protein
VGWWQDVDVGVGTGDGGKVVTQPDLPSGTKTTSSTTTTTTTTTSSTTWSTEWVREWAEGSYDERVTTVHGPWGSKEEITFSAGYGDISEIEVAYNKDYVVRVQTTYVVDGVVLRQSPQGGRGGEVAKVSDWLDCDGAAESGCMGQLRHRRGRPGWAAERDVSAG